MLKPLEVGVQVPRSFYPEVPRKVSYGNLRMHSGEVFRRLAEKKECLTEEGHLLPDHVHMMISVLPKYSVSSVAEFIKGKSAIHLARQTKRHSDSEWRLVCRKVKANAAKKISRNGWNGGPLDGVCAIACAATGKECNAASKVSRRRCKMETDMGCSVSRASQEYEAIVDIQPPSAH